MPGNREPGNKNSGEQTGEYDAWEEIARQASAAWQKRTTAGNSVASGVVGAEAGTVGSEATPAGSERTGALTEWGEVVTPGEVGGPYPKPWRR